MVLPMKSGGAETKFEREAGCTRLPIRAGPLFLEKGWEGRGSHMISGGKNSIWRKQRFLSAGVTDFSFFVFLFHLQFLNLRGLHVFQLADACLFIIQVHGLLKDLVHKAINETIVSLYHFEV